MFTAWSVPVSRFVICVDVCCLQQEKSKQLRDWKDKTFLSSSSLQKWDALVFRRHVCFSGASLGWGLLRSSAWDKGLSWVSSIHEMNQGSAPFRVVELQHLDLNGMEPSSVSLLKLPLKRIQDVNTELRRPFCSAVVRDMFSAAVKNR